VLASVCSGKQRTGKCYAAQWRNVTTKREEAQAKAAAARRRKGACYGSAAAPLYGVALVRGGLGGLDSLWLEAGKAWGGEHVLGARIGANEGAVARRTCPSRRRGR
jgi:hypothetical protein